MAGSGMPMPSQKPQGPRPQGPRKVTPARLERWALAYLERFSASAESLKRVLMRRVDRSAKAHGTDREADGRLVEALIERYLANGLLNDRRFAEGRVAALRRRGASGHSIRQRLAAKGVAREVIQDTLAQAPGDLAAAAALARRRRLGPYRPAENRAANQERDLAALARGGFGYDVARKVIEAESVDALTALVGEAG